MSKRRFNSGGRFVLTQPHALYTVSEMSENGQLTSKQIPVPENLWKYFSTRKQAAGMQQRTLSDVSPSASTVFDGLNTVLFIPVLYLNDDERIWVTAGYTTEPDSTKRKYIEYCGWLFDRKTHPAPGDGDGDTLVAQVISTDLVELHWSES
jgi:hypothetical protein